MMTVNHKLILKEVQDYVFITLGLLLYSFGFTVFLMPYEIVTGGVTGISAIVFYATGFQIEYTYLLINIVLLALGCVLETVSIILIILPMLYPIVKHLGFDLIWFNVVMLINMELALITPPIGMNLFVIKGISPDSSLQQIISGSIPFALIMAGEIALLCLAPDLATWLPAVLK
jgi:C4-dicarboxylate transporter DctM subunit